MKSKAKLNENSALTNNNVNNIMINQGPVLVYMMQNNDPGFDPEEEAQSNRSLGRAILDKMSINELETISKFTSYVRVDPEKRIEQLASKVDQLNTLEKAASGYKANEELTN